jgi:hypothetical protein
MNNAFKGIQGSLKRWMMNRNRVVFDASNPAHLIAFANFLKNGKWNAIHPDGSIKEYLFALEIPYDNVPDMIYRKIAVHTLQTKLGDKSIQDPAVVAAMSSGLLDPEVSDTVVEVIPARGRNLVAC